ncbi:MAG: hypothetical protein QOH71_3845 [Blastocatellia bacterium]|jgi:hypothetical protein|nr:hypothetical protein [Blastocatellia bacterium]
MQPQFVPVSLTKPAIVIGAILTLLTLGGFGVLTSAAVELSRAARLAPEGITGIVITGMLIILIADVFLVRLLTKIINASLSSNLQAPPRRAKALSNPSAVYLPQPATARLRGVPSVTEGTTRFFEAYRTATSEDRPTSEISEIIEIGSPSSAAAGTVTQISRCQRLGNGTHLLLLLGLRTLRNFLDDFESEEYKESMF